VKNGLWLHAPVIEGFANDTEVNDSVTTSRPFTGDVASDQAYINFLNLSRVATARASLARGIRGEKFLTLSLNENGEVVVSNFAVLRGQGARVGELIQGAVLPVTAIAHVHPPYLQQRPGPGDDAAVRILGIPSFVISGSGRTLWEIGQENGVSRFRTVHRSRPGRWRDF